MLRIALVGAGAIAQTHAEAFLRHAHRCQIVAVCNRHTQRAQELIELLSLPAQAFATLEEAIANAYAAAKPISFQDIHMRTDIGKV